MDRAQRVPPPGTPPQLQDDALVGEHRLPVCLERCARTRISRQMLNTGTLVTPLP